MDLLLLAAGDVVLKPRALLMCWMFGFSPDGSALVTASGDGQVKFFLLYLHVEVPSCPSIVSPPVESSLRKASLLPVPSAGRY